jgi:long-chain acyl-CoA synthetase
VAAAAVLASMDQVAKEAKLRGFEQAKAVFLTAEPFSIENGLLTPTFKVRSLKTWRSLLETRQFA